MTQEKKAAAKSVGDAYGGKRNLSKHNIAESGGNVKDDWAERAARQEHQENTEKFGEIKAALLGRLPAVHNGITYRRVSAIILHWAYPERLLLAVELEDKCGHSVTVAAPRKVQVIHGNEPEAAAESSGPDTQINSELKKALFQRLPVICNGEEYSGAAAILYRVDSLGRVYLQAELKSLREGRIETVTPMEVEIQNAGSCDEFCEIKARRSQDDTYGAIP